MMEIVKDVIFSILAPPFCCQNGMRQLSHYNMIGKIRQYKSKTALLYRAAPATMHQAHIIVFRKDIIT